MYLQLLFVKITYMRLKPGFHMIVRMLPIVPVVSKNV